MESDLERTKFTIPYPGEQSSISFEVSLAFFSPAQQVLLPILQGDNLVHQQHQMMY